MKNVVLGSVVFMASLSLGGVASACDMHGGGFGAFGMGNANWQSYTPMASKTDPAFADQTVVPLEKSKPSFSNAANMAALKAKARMAKKKQDKPAKMSDDKAVVKKATLDADG